MARNRKKLPPGGLDAIRQLGAHGASEIAIANALHMDVKTWRRIREDDPEAKEAWETARLVEHDNLVGSLYRAALGSPAEHDVDGNEVVQETKPTPSCAMFLLRCRHSYRDSGAPDGTAESAVKVVITLPAALDGAAWRAMVEVAPVSQDGDDT